ncbi:MAG: hypothetical protein OQK51_19685 [Kangiellaceae bacterium]|nr:hypothetical protein [Kangiellaceae bacterium]
MPLDQKPHFIVVHGVQAGSDEDIESKQQIESLLQSKLDEIELDSDFDVIGVTYEDENDEAQQPYKWLVRALTTGNPLASIVLTKVLDVVGDVFTNSWGTETANKIRSKIKAAVLDSYQAGHPVYLIAHSLGTVYCLDVVCELMAEDEFYLGDDRDTWPVQSYVSMGSPLGLTNIFSQRNIPALQNASYEKLSWHNFHHPMDPVVTGNVFGAPGQYAGAEGPVEQTYTNSSQSSGWTLQGHKTVANDQWLIAHVSYWDEPIIGDTLVDMVWG